jgi:C1A family cysteine protease
MAFTYFGWLPDYPDIRDRTIGYNKPNEKPVPDFEKKLSIKELRNKASAKSKKKILTATRLPDKVTGMEQFFTPADEQGENNSCTAQAGAALVEYFENKISGGFEKKSRMFLYKATRNLLRLEGDTGAFVRSTMKALVLFGVPPEKYWPYVTENLNTEPSQFCYAFAQNYQAIQYYRLDNIQANTTDLLHEIKINLIKELPLMFGFTVYNNISTCKNGLISFPSDKNKLVGGHAVVAVGYDDKKKIPVTGTDKFTTGAMRIRNSWGEDWGEDGYGWLPYEYLISGLAKDFWSIIKNEWIDNKVFE